MSEDDWETADLTPSITTAKAKSKLSLRAGAPTFQPRPAASVEAGPSRLTPSSGTYIARTPITGNDDPARGSLSAGGSNGGDEWFRGPKPASNRQIWDAANNRLPSPLPTSIASPGITLASPIPQPGITILRRQPGPEKKRGGGTQTPPKTMEEREKEYRLARERIFGGAGGGPAAVAAEAGDAGLAAERSRSGGGRSRTPGQGRESGVERVASPANRLFEAGEQPGLGPVPVQVRRSPAPGVLRQPMGPGEGGGFGR